MISISFIIELEKKKSIFAPEMKKKMIRIFKIILPALFIAYLASTSFFYHTHIVNGVTIVHSHPFEKKGHTHTQKGYLIINLMAHYISDGVIVPHFSFTPLYTFTHYIIQPVINETAQGIIIPTSSRGPPYNV